MRRRRESRHPGRRPRECRPRRRGSGSRAPRFPASPCRRGRCRCLPFACRPCARAGSNDPPSAAYDVQIFEPLIMKCVAVGARRRCAATQGRTRRTARRSPGTRSRVPRPSRKMKPLLLRRTEAHQRRTDPVDVHVLRTARLAGGPHLFAEDEVLPDRTAAPPYSVGQCGTSRPASARRGQNDTENSVCWREPGPCRAISLQLPGNSAFKKSTTRARKAFSQSEKAKSIRDL